VRRILVVANQTLGGDHLAELVRARAAEGPTEVLLLVPATHHTDLLVALAEAFAGPGATGCSRSGEPQSACAEVGADPVGETLRDLLLT
jgi:hypothetical protein